MYRNLSLGLGLGLDLEVGSDRILPTCKKEIDQKMLHDFICQVVLHIEVPL